MFENLQSNITQREEKLPQSVFEKRDQSSRKWKSEVIVQGRRPVSNRDRLEMKMKGAPGGDLCRVRGSVNGSEIQISSNMELKEYKWGAAAPLASVKYFILQLRGRLSDRLMLQLLLKISLHNVVRF